MLAQPHIEQELEAWTTRSRTEGTYHEIMDSTVWKTMKTASGKKFFDPAIDDELHIGVTLSLDWSVTF